MPRPPKGPRLWFRAESHRSDGRLRSSAQWFIRDGSRLVGTGCSKEDRRAAEAVLARYILESHRPQAPTNSQAALVADVLNLYLTDIAPAHARPADTAARCEHLLTYFGAQPIAAIKGASCRAYWQGRTSINSARRELEDLRAALNHWRREGHAVHVPTVALPPRPQPRMRFLTRSEAAQLLLAAWRMRQEWKGASTSRATGRHVARFILVALYTGTRSAAICGAAMRPGVANASGYVDLESGIYWRKPPGAAQNNKRQPPVPIPPRLLAHLRRWHRLGISRDFVVEWNGKPVASIKRALRAARAAAGLGPDVTAHVLRHTTATWLLQAGVDMWQAAKFLGMSVETLERVYGHYAPDHLQAAAKAISSAPQKPHRNSVNKTRRTASRQTGTI